MKNLLQRRSFPLASLAVLLVISLALLPQVDARWTQVLGFNIQAQSGPGAAPSATPRTPTPSDMPLHWLQTATFTPVPGDASTILSANLSAYGFYEAAHGNRTNHDVPEAAPIPANFMGNTSYGVQGKVCVKNEGDQPTQRLRIVVQVEAREGDREFADLPGLNLEIPVDRQLASHETRCFAYRIEFDPGQHVYFRSVTRVTIINHAGWIPGSPDCPGPEACPFGLTAKAQFNMPSVDRSTRTPVPRRMDQSTPTAFLEANGSTPSAAPTLQATATLPGAPTATQGTAQPSATLALPTAVPVTVEPSPTERGPLATQMPVLPTPGGEPVN